MSDYDLPDDFFDMDEDAYNDYLESQIDSGARPDNAEALLDEVLDNLGISDFDEIVVSSSQAVPENVRGNRYVNLIDAILDLHASGILRFSRAVYDYDEEDFSIEVDSETGGTT